MPGSAASQNSSVGGELEADRGQLRDHHRPDLPDRERQQQRRDRNPEIAPRDRRALVVSQKVLSSGRQSVRTAPDSAPTCSGLWISCISGSSGSFFSASPTTPRSICRIAMCIQTSEPVTSRNSSMKQLVHRPVRSTSAPNAIGSTKPPRPPIMPTSPPTAPTLFGIVDRDVLVDGGLAERHEEAEHEHGHRERHQPHFQVEADGAVDRLHQIVGRRIGQHEGRRRRRPGRSSTSRAARRSDRRDARHRRGTRWPAARTSQPPCRRS